MQDIFLGIIGGSGLYEVEGLRDATWQDVSTPYGPPSDQILTGRLGDLRVAFLPRHGRGHVHSPSDLPYLANIDAMKRLGVTEIMSLSACGSFREEMAPGDFVLVDQFIDRTKSRPHSFFGAGCVAHVSMAYPTCSRLGQAATGPPPMQELPCTPAAPIWQWRGHSFPPWPNRASTARSWAAM